MKKFLSLVLALVMTMSLVTISAGAKDFTDDSKIAYKEAVDVMSAVKVIDGYTDGAFNPQNTLTRGAAAKIICNMILGPTTAAALGADAAPFKDVPVSNTFAGYIAYCAQQGIIGGYADGTFRPAGTVTGYQFMKMLLGALGYDSATEGFSGANWSVNVAKLAMSLGLDNGNDEFNGTAAMTREQACLYAFNTLKTTMVEYSNNASNITIGGVTITQGKGKASDVVNNASSEGIKNDNAMQFAEKYFKDLKKDSDGTDDFGRPATTWKNKSVKVGTYASSADASFTKDVTTGDIYAALGMSDADNNVDVYFNGDAVAAVKVSKNNTAKLSATNGAVGNGTTVEVFYDEDNNDVTIVEIGNYVGTIAKSVAATKSDDAYVVVAELDGSNPITTSTNKFETDETFADDAVVMYTYANGAIQSVVAAASVEGTLTTYTMGKSASVGDVVYKYAQTIAFGDGSEAATMSTKNDYVVYTDANGYLAYIEAKAFVSTDFAIVLSSQVKDNTAFTSNKASLVTADGKNLVVNTSEAYAPATYAGKIVTYKVNDNGDYTLRLASGNGGTVNNVTTVGNATTAADDATTATFTIAKNMAAVQFAAGTIKYADSRTVFVVRTVSGGTESFKAYVGIANAPSTTGTAPAYYYCKSGAMLSFVYINAEGLTVSTSSNDALFIGGKSVSGLITDRDNNQYYTYNAIVRGEEKVIKVAPDATGYTAGSKANAVFASYSVNDDDIITAFGTYSSNPSSASGTGVKKVSGDYTVGFGVNAVNGYQTVATDAKVFTVSTKGVISAITLNQVTTDDAVGYTYVMDNGKITYLFIQEVDSGSSSGADGNVSGNLTGIALTNATTMTLTIGASAPAATYDVSLYVLNGGTYVPMNTYTVSVAANATTATIAIGGTLAAGSYKMVCGNITNFGTI